MNTIDFAVAEKFLSKADPVMRKLIKNHGACGLVPQAKRSPFESLARAIAHQQLNGTAAESILRRFVQLFPGQKFPKPEDILTAEIEQIRACGFSYAKIASLRDLATKACEGIVPTSRKIVSMSDEEIIARLTQIRGIGRWTVEMLLIFQLGRPDVLPVDDFGVRKGFANAYGLDEMPKPKALAAHGEVWKPHRTVASWYLWRAANPA